jgi:hypothetical protein
MGRIDRREELSLALVSAKLNTTKIAAVGAAKNVDAWAQKLDSAQRAAYMAHMVSIGMTFLALRNGLASHLHKRAVAELAGELLIRHRRIIATDFEFWVDESIRHGEKIQSPDHLSAVAVARQAIQEHIIDVCPTCSGRGEVPDHDVEHLDGPQPMKLCDTCGGSGSRRYSTDERKQALSASVDHRRVNDRLDEAIQVIRNAESYAIEAWAQQMK